jgi:hypothetical protein
MGPRDASGTTKDLTLSLAGQPSGRRGVDRQVQASTAGRADVGGDRGGHEAGTSLGSPRWRRMRVITAVCSVSAITWSRPLQRPHASTSNANVRRISAAQRSPRTRMARGA